MACSDTSLPHNAQAINRTDMHQQHRHTCYLATLVLIISVSSVAHANERSTGVVVYDATPAGIAAAVATAESDCDVLLIEPSSRIGGMVTGGLSHPDFKTFESLSGAFLDLTNRVQRHYEVTYGPQSPQAQDCFRGTHAEPKVNLHVFHEMLREHPRITLLHGYRVVDTETRREGDRQRVVSAEFANADGNRLTVRGRLFIDAGYEGDLMAAAGVTYRIGREARATYGESFAPEKADDQLQGYNFRLVFTKEPKNRVMPSAPEGYDRAMFTDVVPLLMSGEIKSVFARWRDCLYKAHTPVLPNGKYDINDVSSSPVRLSLPQINDAWPEGDPQTRERIFQQHVRHNVGLLYFLQNDEAIPEKFRDEARQWGFCADEFAETNHLSSELYVREARRMQGMYTYTQNDTADAQDDARAILHTDSIAMGDYGHSCHGTAHEGPLFGGKHTGAFHHGRRPYQVPYGVLVPKQCVNLLVPTACSSSHIGFCALRLEPIWMNMGQAAGVAAGIALQENQPVQDVSVTAIQQQLHARGAATLYISDVLPGDKDFELVQWWGTLGGWHGIERRPQGSRTGPEIRDHYDQAFRGHEAQLQQSLTADVRDRWLAIIDNIGLSAENFLEAKSRREFIGWAYEQSVSAPAETNVGE